MPYYNPYQTTPAMQPYMQQGQYLSMQNMPVQGMPIPGMPDTAGMQQYIYPANIPEALNLIAGGVAGEREDRLFYEYLISTAPTEEDKEIIRGIRDNEIRHFSLFRQIYYQLTGQLLPQPKILLSLNPLLIVLE